MGNLDKQYTYLNEAKVLSLTDSQDGFIMCSDYWNKYLQWKTSMRNQVRNWESSRLRSFPTRGENRKAWLHFEAKEGNVRKIVMKDVRGDLHMSNSQNEASGKVTQADGKLLRLLQ